jgi:hypothetical protein
VMRRAASTASTRRSPALMASLNERLICFSVSDVWSPPFDLTLEG